MTGRGRRAALAGGLAVLLVLAILAPAATRAADPTNPETCRSIWEAVGLPVSHKDPGALLLNVAGDIDPPSVIVCHKGFVVQYNCYTKNPDWVIERLSPATTEGDNTRPNVKFVPEPAIPAAAPAPAPAAAPAPNPCVSAVDDEYRNSGLARGHNAASADFKADREAMVDTFVLSNAVPQVQNGFNGGTWKELEEHVQDLARSLGEGEAIYVITGPVDLPADGAPTVIAAAQNACNREIRLAGLERLLQQKAAICDANDANPSAMCNHGVAVPAGLFKIIYEPRMDRVFAFVMSNEDHRGFKQKGISHTAYFERWRASIDVIEEATNLDFFPGKPRRWRNIHEASCAETRWRQ